MTDSIDTNTDMELRVKNTTNVQHLATSIVKNIEEGRKVFMSCIGVQSISQATKSLAIANGKVAPTGYMLCCIPAFHHVLLDGENGEKEKKTIVRLLLRRINMGD